MVALNHLKLDHNLSSAEVLLVEDEEISRRALALLLHANGFTATTATSGEEALQLLSQGAHPRLALVDLDLPGMNGIEFIAQLANIHPDIVAVLITASSLERLHGMLGNQHLAYMRKPIDVGRLLNLLAETRHHA